MRRAHTGSEAALTYLTALPFVQKLEHQRRGLKFAEECFRLDALAHVDSSMAIERAGLDRTGLYRTGRELTATDVAPDSSSDIDRRLLQYLGWSAPFSGASNRRITKCSLGGPCKGIHDDHNAMYTATVHRTLTEAELFETEIIVYIHGRPIVTESKTKSMLFFYAWLPHESKCVENQDALRRGTRKGTTSAARLAGDERLYITSYDRASTEDFVAVVDHARRKAPGGLPAAHLLS